jgi:uncharacterized membrane protein (DUF106 family)
MSKPKKKLKKIKKMVKRLKKMVKQIRRDQTKLKLLMLSQQQGIVANRTIVPGNDRPLAEP